MAKVNDRQKHIILTGRVKTNGTSYKKIKKYLNDNKWNYTEINKDGQTRFKTGRFNQASAGKFKLEKWLADNNWSYQVLLYDGK